jgi:hypothetical protein
MSDHDNYTEQHNVEFKEFFEWLNIGIEKKFATKPYCDPHEGAPLEDWEFDLWDSGTDPCMTAIRLLGPYGPNELQRDQAIADGTITAREAK